MENTEETNDGCTGMCCALKHLEEKFNKPKDGYNGTGKGCSSLQNCALKEDMYDDDDEDNMED